MPPVNRGSTEQPKYFSFNVTSQINLKTFIEIITAGALREPKVRGGQTPQIFKKIPLNSVNSLFIAFSYYNFKTSGGSADPTDPLLAWPLPQSLTKYA